MRRSIYFLSSFFLLLGFGLPLWSHAENLDYAKIIDNNDTQILVQSGGLEKQNYFLCLVATLNCTDLGASVPSAITKSFGAKGNPAVDMLTEIGNWVENGATRLTLSPDQNFYAYYLPAKLTNKTIKTHSEREFALLDLRSSSQPKKYSFKSNVNYWDLLSEELKIFAFSPKETKMVYLDDKNGPPTLYWVDLTHLKKNSLPGQRISTKKYSISDFIFSNENTLYFVANRDNPYIWSLYRYSFSDGSLSKITDNISYNQTMQKVGDNILFLQIINNSTVPALYNLTSRKVHYFVGLEPNQTVTPRGTYVSLSGIPGVLIKPANFNPKKSYPLLVWLHGGPYRQASLGYHPYMSYAVYDWLLQEAVKSGAIVLKLDYRGSYGFGRPYAESIKNNVGTGDVSDVLKAVGALKNKYKIGQTYLEGNSYGGYLALRTLVEKPASFAGAFSINGVTDWGTLLNQLSTSIFNMDFGGLVDEGNEAMFQQAAIVNRFYRLTNQKVIIAQAAADRTIPPSQADLASYYMAKVGKAADLVKYPGEDHVFHKASSLDDLCLRTLKMMDLDTTGRCDLQ